MCRPHAGPHIAPKPSAPPIHDFRPTRLSHTHGDPDHPGCFLRPQPAPKSSQPWTHEVWPGSILPPPGSPGSLGHAAGAYGPPAGGPHPPPGRGSTALGLEAGALAGLGACLSNWGGESPGWGHGVPQMGLGPPGQALMLADRGFLPRRGEYPHGLGEYPTHYPFWTDTLSVPSVWSFSLAWPGPNPTQPW